MRFYFPIRDLLPGEQLVLEKEHDIIRAEGLGLSPSVPASGFIIRDLSVSPVGDDKLLFRATFRSCSEKTILVKAFMYDRNDPIAMMQRFQDRAAALADETDPDDVRARETYLQQAAEALAYARKLDEDVGG